MGETCSTNKEDEEVMQILVVKPEANQPSWES